MDLKQFGDYIDAGNLNDLPKFYRPKRPMMPAVRPSSARFRPSFGVRGVPSFNNISAGYKVILSQLPQGMQFMGREVASFAGWLWNVAKRGANFVLTAIKRVSSKVGPIASRFSNNVSGGIKSAAGYAKDKFAKARIKGAAKASIMSRDLKNKRNKFGSDIKGFGSSMRKSAGERFNKLSGNVSRIYKAPNAQSEGVSFKGFINVPYTANLAFKMIGEGVASVVIPVTQFAGRAVGKTVNTGARFAGKTIVVGSKIAIGATKWVVLKVAKLAGGAIRLTVRALNAFNTEMLKAATGYKGPKRRKGAPIRNMLATLKGKAADKAFQKRGAALTTLELGTLGNFAIDSAFGINLANEGFDKIFDKDSKEE